MTTHVLMIVDMSGSMHDLAEDVRGGFNTYLSDLESQDGPFSITATVFDTEFISLCVAESLQNTPRLTEKNYHPRGMTALLDAVGKTILEFESGTALNDGDKVLVLVQTDGNENSSAEFSNERISDMIKTRKATGQWSFVFLGAGPNTWRQAGLMGFMRANTVSYDKGQTRSSYSGISRGTGQFSRGASGQSVAHEIATASGGVVHLDDEDDKE